MLRFWRWLSQEHTAITALAGMTAIVAGLSGTAFGVITILRDDPVNADLQQQSVSIVRRLGDGVEYYDVRDILRTTAEARSELAGSQFFPEDGFYAIDDDRLGDWEYSLSTEEDLFLSVNRGNEAAEECAELIFQPGNPSLHLWSSEERELVITDTANPFPSCVDPSDPGGGDPFVMNVFDYVFVERLGHEELAGIYAGDPEESDGEPANELVGSLEEIYRGDSAAIALIGQLSVMLPTGDPSIRPVLEQMGKIGNVVYIQSYWEVNDALVDGEEQGVYFLDFEAIIITTEEDTWLIRSLVASPDHHSGSVEWLEDWFDGFGIIEDD